LPWLFYLPLVPTRGFVKPKGNKNREAASHSPPLCFGEKKDVLILCTRRKGGKGSETVTRSRGIATGFSGRGIKVVTGIRRRNTVSAVNAVPSYKTVAKNDFIIYRYRNVLCERSTAAFISAAASSSVIVSVPITIHHFNPPNLRICFRPIKYAAAC